MKLMIVFGTRPEIIKLAPVILMTKSMPKFDVITLSTGQHRHMLDQGLKVFGITPDIDLNVMIENQSLEQLTSNLLVNLSSAIKEIEPDVVMVQGDTTTAFVAALAAFYQQIPVAHVEAGLRTGDLSSPFPEELNRSIIGQIAKWNFAPTVNAKINLLKEGVKKDKIFVTGNTIVDAIKLLAGSANAIKNLEATTSIVPQSEFVLITAHRRENHGSGIESICAAIKELAISHPELEFIFPVHLNPKVRETVLLEFKDHKQVRLIEPVDFKTLLYLESKAKLIITDSGGIQEEAPSFFTPVIVTRLHTERAEGIEAGFAKLTGVDKNKIVELSNNFLYNKNFRKELVLIPNPYGDGEASIRILKILLSHRVEEFKN
jgi:UDP-N-acetylglucosamine 2-epimerase (non-hydrolysing)